MDTDLTVIIPNFNGATLLREYLPAALEAAASCSARVELLVVDDASRDDSVRVLRERFRDVGVIRLERNAGFQAACNAGAAASRSRLLLFLNNDMRVAADALTPMCRHFDDPAVFAVGGRSLVTRWGAGDQLRGGPWNETITEGSFRSGWLELRYPGVVPQRDTSELFPDPRPVLYAPGGLLMCRRDRFVALGGFELLYAPFTVEDLDLCYRAWKRGWTVRYEPQSMVWHEHSATIGRRSARLRRALMARNFFLFHWRNLTDRDLVCQHALGIASRLGRSLARREQAWAVGMVLTGPRLRRALRARAHERRLAVVADREVVRRSSESLG